MTKTSPKLVQLLSATSTKAIHVATNCLSPIIDEALAESVKPNLEEFFYQAKKECDG